MKGSFVYTEKASSHG